MRSTWLGWLIFVILIVLLLGVVSFVSICGGERGFSCGG
jgi:hypothetical protein